MSEDLGEPLDVDVRERVVPALVAPLLEPIHEDCAQQIDLAVQDAPTV